MPSFNQTQTVSEANTALKGGKATTQVRECNELLIGEKQKESRQKVV